VEYQVPPEQPHFIPREPQQSRAARAVAEWSGQRRPLCLSLSGLAGVGKTELAFTLARSLRDGYRDGVLYVDLDELRRDGAVDLSDILGDLLRLLDVGPDCVGRSFAALRRQYWSLTDGKRLLVILDNARYGSEIVPLLPASGDSAVIVASHGPLADLDDGAALELPLPPLDDEHALRLLRLIAADERLTTEPDAAAELIRLCSGLPAALQVAGRWIRRHRHRTLARLLTELRAELDRKGLPEVERLWDAAYAELGPDGALLYQLLADHPVLSFTPDVATALLGRGREAAEEALEELEAAGLLDRRDVLDTRDDRRRLPELLRGHALRCARRDGGEREQQDARRRLVGWCLRQAQRADALAAGSRLLVTAPAPPLPDAPDVEFADKGEALRWLEVERHLLYRCVRLAHGLGLDAEAAGLCEPMWTRFLDHRHAAEDIAAFRLGVEAGQRSGDLRVLARMRCQLARPLWEQGDVDGAAEELRLAGTAAAALGDGDADRRLRASVEEFCGMFCSVRGDWAGAAAHFEASRRVHTEIGNRYGVLLQTYRLGEAAAALGQPERAAALLTECHDEAEAMGRERITARTGSALAGVLAGLGRADEARELYQAALVSARVRHAEAEECAVLDALGDLAEKSGRGDEAVAHRAAARIVRERNGLG
jgi:hypothetical protein